MQSLLQKITFVPIFIISPHYKPSKSCNLSVHLSNLMSWSCKKCTFINSPSPKPTCQICLSPPSPPSLPSSSSNQETPKWSCKACTFLNPYKNSSCEVCGTRGSVYSLSSLEDLTDTSGLDGDVDSSVGSVFMPLRHCKRKVRDSVDDHQEGGCRVIFCVFVVCFMDFVGFFVCLMDECCLCMQLEVMGILRNRVHSKVLKHQTRE